MKRVSTFLFILAMVLIFSMQAQATLFDRGTDSLDNRLIYDSDLNITWYDYTNAANTWQNQVDWASGLSINFGGTIYDDWRLPITVGGTLDQSCDGTGSLGYNITSSEMGHLYYTELGNIAFRTNDCNNINTGWGLVNKGPFTNLQTDSYWSGTEFAAVPTTALSFLFSNGLQNFNSKGSNNFSALAVHDGDVSVAVAPEPMSMVLFGIGGAVMSARRKLIRRRNG